MRNGICKCAICFAICDAYSNKWFLLQKFIWEFHSLQINWAEQRLQMHIYLGIDFNNRLGRHRSRRSSRLNCARGESHQKTYKSRWGEVSQWWLEYMCPYYWDTCHIHMTPGFCSNVFIEQKRNRKTSTAWLFDSLRRRRARRSQRYDRREANEGKNGKSRREASNAKQRRRPPSLLLKTMPNLSISI